MKSQALAAIFNSTQREVEETASYRCFYTFNFKDPKSGFKELVGPLLFLNNAFLSPQESITYKQEEDTQVIILPIAGALTYQNGVQKEGLVKSEQVKIMEIGKGMSYTFTNPFEKEWVNYLHIGFRMDSFSVQQPHVLQSIELKKMNELVCFDLGAPDQPSGCIGMYQGRKEDNYRLKKTDNGVFVYIIKGAFEVQGRLLEIGDGLSLWNTKEIEFEALSNNAVILLLEMKLK